MWIMSVTIMELAPILGLQAIILIIKSGLFLSKLGSIDSQSDILENAWMLLEEAEIKILM